MSDTGGEDEAEPVAQLPAETQQRFIEILRQHGTDDPERVLAQLNQYFLSVHQPDSEYEGLMRAAKQMETVDPGSGQQFIRAVLADYERQSALQEREQIYLEKAQSVRHRHATGGARRRLSDRGSRGRRRRLLRRNRQHRRRRDPTGRDRGRDHRRVLEDPRHTIASPKPGFPAGGREMLTRCARWPHKPERSPHWALPTGSSTVSGEGQGAVTWS